MTIFTFTPDSSGPSPEPLGPPSKPATLVVDPVTGKPSWQIIPDMPTKAGPWHHSSATFVDDREPRPDHVAT